MQIEFTLDHEYAGIQYYDGDRIDMYDEEAQGLIRLGVACEVEQMDEAK